MVDPKMVELGNYNGHSAPADSGRYRSRKRRPVRSTGRSREMERRYKLFADHQRAQSGRL